MEQPHPSEGSIATREASGKVMRLFFHPASSRAGNPGSEEKPQWESSALETPEVKTLYRLQRRNSRPSRV
jgi:hypothetical protein